METLDAPTPSALLVMCQEYMSFARPVQDKEKLLHNHPEQYALRQKFFKNTILFTMILDNLLSLLAIDNAENEEIVEIAEAAYSLRRTVLDLCDTHRPRIQSFVSAVDNFILRLQSVSKFLTASDKACVKFTQLAQCVSVLQTADYHDLEVLNEKLAPPDEEQDEGEKLAPSDEELDKDEELAPSDEDEERYSKEYVIEETLCRLCRYFPSLSGFSYNSGTKTFLFEAHMVCASYKKDKAEILWICQEYSVIFRQEHDESEIDYLVETFPRWWRYLCCFACFCFCIRNIVRERRRKRRGVRRRAKSWCSW